MDSTTLMETIRRAVEPHTPRMASLYLFGSRARGEADAKSDVDLGVLYREEPRSSLEGLGLDIADAVTEATGLEADVVVLNRAPPDLVHRVLRDGILVLETDRSARIGFEVRSRAEYLDLLPYLREYRRASASHHDRP
ncbi:MAG: type VII toxin-antitoxin system MntA family adenylyltransferase antitoxin [Pseudomonadota bacterium]